MQTLDPDTELLVGEYFKERLAEEVECAARDGLPYSVIACVPQHLPGEGVADVAQVAAACVRSLIREQDLAGRLNDEIVAIGLPETNSAGARVLAHRLKNELSRRSGHLRSTKWQAGIACLPKDGWGSEELLQAAIQAAKISHRLAA